MGDWPFCSEAVTQSHRFGFRIWVATGSSLQIHSLITSDWWLCTWAFPTGSMPSQKLVLTHQLFNGLDSSHLRDWPLILKTEKTKSFWIERKTAKQVKTITKTTNLNSKMTKSKLKASREKEEEWSSKQKETTRQSLKSSTPNHPKLRSTQNR